VSPSPLSPSQSAASFDLDMGREERSLWMLPIALWIVALCIPAALVVFGVIVAVLYVGNSFNSFGSFGQGLEQLGQSVELGGTTADAAASAAASQPPGSLSVSELNTELPKYAWVDGATNVPSSSATRYIVGGTQVVRMS
jgi:hypothetical protein